MVFMISLCSIEIAQIIENKRIIPSNYHVTENEFS